jgi:cation:H+ antiporter
MDYLYILVGLFGLFFGGEALVRGSVAVAERLGLSKLVIGLTIVGFGTSTPELLVSLNAALQGSSDIALGNVVGSNTANILLILGLSALVYPIMNWDQNVRRDVLVALAVAVLTLILVQFSVIGRVSGLIMFGALLAYLWYIFTSSKVALSQITDTTDPHQQSGLSPLLAAGAILLGLVLLVFGADFLVEGATNIARSYGISEAVIGLTIVAVGTSLPELATSVLAALRKHSDVALGNVVGSNIFNVLGILGLTAIVQPVGVSSGFASFDVPVMLATTLGLAALLFFTKSIDRRIGAVMIGLYVIYTAVLFV